MTQIGRDVISIGVLSIGLYWAGVDPIAAIMIALGVGMVCTT